MYRSRHGTCTGKRGKLERFLQELHPVIQFPMLGNDIVCIVGHLQNLYLRLENAHPLKHREGADNFLGTSVQSA